MTYYYDYFPWRFFAALIENILCDLNRIYVIRRILLARAPRFLSLAGVRCLCHSKTNMH